MLRRRRRGSMTGGDLRWTTGDLRLWVAGTEARPTNLFIPLNF